MALTYLVLYWANGGSEVTEDVSQRLGVSGDSGDIGGDGREVGRGGCCRAEEAEGEGSEDREGERAHGE